MKHLQTFGGNQAYTKAGFGVGTTTTLTTANTQQWSIKGKSYTKAGTSNEATPTTDYVKGAAFAGVPINKQCVFLLCRDSGGNLRAIQGQTNDLGGLAPEYGPDHNDVCPLASVLVKVGPTGATWTFGASNFAGPPTGVTFTFTDFAGGMPARPQA